MFAPPALQLLSGERLHLSHGPIDIVLKAWGESEDVNRAYAAAWDRFARILPELTAELGELRKPMSAAPVVESPVARRMLAACTPFADIFVTPMAAVAGAVADEVLEAMLAAAALKRVYVNDGGDIAVHVAPGERLEIGVAGEFSRGDIPALNGRVLLQSEHAIGGIATSGARGRSFSLGIADAVTVLATNAASADVAATLIANAVDLDCGAIVRRPATDLDPDSDLGETLVTVSVGQLDTLQVDAALQRGLLRADAYRRAGLIRAAALTLRGRSMLCDEAIAAEPLLFN